MPIIDPEALKASIRGTRIIEIRNDADELIGWKGPFSPDTYDNYTECLKVNQAARSLKVHKELGMNQFAQTKEVAKAFDDKKRIQLRKKEVAELALMGAANEMKR